MYIFKGASLGGSAVKNSPALLEAQEMYNQSLGQEDPLEKEIATHSSVLAWEIPWTDGCGQMFFLSQNGDLVLISKCWSPRFNS